MFTMLGALRARSHSVLPSAGTLAAFARQQHRCAAKAAQGAQSTMFNHQHHQQQQQRRGLSRSSRSSSSSSTSSRPDLGITVGGRLTKQQMEAVVCSGRFKAWLYLCDEEGDSDDTGLDKVVFAVMQIINALVQSCRTGAHSTCDWVGTGMRVRCVYVVLHAAKCMMH
jgi:hypothetical protein